MQPKGTTLPVIIVGAGPCGLVAALTLQQNHIPFVILEKASRERICTNAGSGFDMAKTALNILGDRLKATTDDILLYHGGLLFSTLEGDVYRDSPMVAQESKRKKTQKTKNLEENFRMASANRSELQKLLLDQLFPNKSQDEEGILRCSVTVESYVEEDETKVVVTLSDQSTVTGCALLGCDGVHSKVRACMHKGKEDPLHFCNTNCYWAKTPMPSGSEVEREVEQMQTYKKTGGGVTVILGTGTKKRPGTFFLAPTTGQVLWGIFEQATEPPQTSNDLTRRGGGILTEPEKQEMIVKFLGGGDDDKNWTLAKTVMEHTPAHAITKTGLFDRQNLDLPYTSPGKLVALLGDAAHPQTPFLGQGVNMAITDAYVYATRIAKAIQNNDADTIPRAMARCDTKRRRQQAKRLVIEARRRCDASVSGHWFTVWMMKMLFKYTPMTWLIKDALVGDKSNKEMVDELDKEYA
ncbi:FAD binding domain [Seminavis robusta]|uniref:FAD binding domain n=1 Tax=Seminavis robusta TaxID=568900 RepID=A0A9N8EQF5_9STRA|nr:FAD binding domain [Seminavis robusta]|eukprot:Sro1601_g285170.1 FAD binding domain (466) ;mRNA; f:14850-16247